MGWSIGFDSNWNRDIGYGVPATCDHPECNAKIDRGLAHVCGGEPYGGEDGCGLYFCGSHLFAFGNKCDRCWNAQSPFEPKPDHPDWISWKLTDESWQKWRDENPAEVAKLSVDLIKRQAARIVELESACKEGPPVAWFHNTAPSGGKPHYEQVAQEYACHPAMPLYAAPASNEAMRHEAWQPIEKAPKDRVIQLWVPPFGMWIDGPWRGSWSYVAQQWTLHSPFTAADGRSISASHIPPPTHWMPLPQKPA